MNTHHFAKRYWIGLVVLFVLALSVGIGHAAITAPTDISGSVLWLDASDLASITSAGGFVSQWNDKSAVGTNHFTQGTGGQQPQTGAVTLNGLNLLTFDGSNDHLLGSPVLAGNDDDYTYLAVWRPHTTSGARSVYEQAQGGNGRRSALLAVNNAYGFNGQNNDRHNLVPFAANQWRLTDMEVNNSNANNIKIYDNGNLYVGATGNPGALDIGTAGATVGKKQTTFGEFLDGDLAEIIVYDRTLTGAEHSDINTYLNNKYNLGITPPPPPGIAHRWSFNDGTADDSIGNADGVLSGGAAIDGQRLRIDGAGKMLTSGIGNPIGEKTMVVWTSLEDLTDRTMGSALTLENNANGDVFDAIVYAELADREWMAGSNFYQRTQDPGGPQESVQEPGEVMIAVVYGPDNSITLYRDGVLYGASYAKGSLVNYAGSALVQIGPRHGNHADVYDGWVNEARIYNYALSPNEIGILHALGPNRLEPDQAGDIPEPATMALLSLAAVGLAGYVRKRK